MKDKKDDEWIGNHLDSKPIPFLEKLFDKFSEENPEYRKQYDIYLKYRRDLEEIKK